MSRLKERERASGLGGEARTEMTALGWIDFHTRPCSNAVVANASTSTSALDCALFFPPICIPQSENSFRSKLFTSRRRILGNNRIHVLLASSPSKLPTHMNIMLDTKDGKKVPHRERV
jgi:hypothetical protein